MLLRINQRNAKIDELENVVRQLSVNVANLTIQVETLTKKASSLPEPARENWERHSCPAWERETITIPAVHIKRVSKHLALLDAPPVENSRELEPPPACPIDRVVVCVYGDLQYILALDSLNRKIEYYSGWSQENRGGKPQLLITLDAYGDHDWEIAKKGSAEWNSVYEAMSA